MDRLAPAASVPDPITRRPRELARARSAPSAVALSLDIPEVCHRDSPALDFESGWIFFDDDCNALLAAKDQLRGTVALNWDTTTVMTEWEGVILGSFGVERLYLHFRGLDGSLPPELGALERLEVLSLGRNELTGEIPPELSSMGSLERLYLQDNQLTGEIPPELGSMNRLRRLYLWSNQLTGEIPPELGSLSSLERLQLASNQFAGEIPPELGRLSRLVWLFLQRNELTGLIPNELGRLTRIERLSLSRNQLTGDIPLELGRLRDLVYLWLYDNELTGSIPIPATGAWEQLRVLWLHDNQLTGEVPAELGNTDLSNLAVSSNDGLTGRLPLELQSLLLGAFYWGGTSLCSPPDPSFQAWLASIPSDEGDNYSGGPVCDSDAGGGTRTYQTGDTISTLPTGSWAPDVVSGATFQLSSGQVTISFDSGGYIEEASIRYTCRASGGCRIVNRVVTQGTIEASGGGGGGGGGGARITSNGGGERATITMPENQTSVTTVTASGGTPPYEFQWSTSQQAPDGRLFVMNTVTGALAFRTAPDYENPTDSDGDNNYVVNVYIVDSSLPRRVSDSQIITVTITDEDEGNRAPDLIVQSPAVDDDTPDAGASFTFSATVRNRGDGQSGSTTLRYYRSSNATISRSDTEVGTDAVGALRASATSLETIALTAPSEAGTYYFGACVDSVDGESSTNNNCSEGVEVEVSGARITSNGGGERATITMPENQTSVTTVTASGGTPPYEFQWSTSQQAPDGRLFVMNTVTGALAFRTAPDYENPTDSDGDNNYVVNVYIVDSSLPRRVSDSQIITVTITDEDEGNRAPDLIVQSPAVDDDTPDAGASFTFSATVRNRGDGQSGSTTLRYYRSSNATISRSDTEVGTDAVGALRASATSLETIALTAPSEAGTYYFGACVDSVDGESSTNNNCSEGVEVEVSGGGGTGRDGECVLGATYGRGESCDVYGTGSSSKLTFMVLSDGRARLGFITAGNGITMKGTVNGVRYHFVASHQGGGVWKVDEYVP